MNNQGAFMSNDNIENGAVDGAAEINTTAEQQEQNQEIDVQALMEQMESMQAKMQKLSNTNERLLNESKQNKSKYQSLKTEVENKERQQLVESENYKELLEIEQNKLFETQEKMKSMKQKVMKANLRSEVAKYAKDAYDIDDIINSLPRDVLELDDDNLMVNGVKEGVDLVRKNKAHLFNKGPKAHGMGEGRPEGYKEEKQEPGFNDIFGEAIKQGLI